MSLLSKRSLLLRESTCMVRFFYTLVRKRDAHQIIYTSDVNKAADAQGVVVVGGFARTVGIAGGWILGGGHSLLSPQYGLGVDSTFFSHQLKFILGTELALHTFCRRA